MQAIKEIHHINNKQLHMQLPESFNNQDVEVIVRAKKTQSSHQAPQYVLSLCGALHKYSNPAKIKEESTAWYDGVHE